MNPNDEREEYEQTFIRFSDKVEAMIKKLLLVCVAIIVAVQCLMQFTPVRHWISRVDPLEGEPFQFGGATRSK